LLIPEWLLDKMRSCRADRELRQYHSVHQDFTVAREGKTVEEVAAEHGWTSDAAEEGLTARRHR
jgi:hypothetical protein